MTRQISLKFQGYWRDENRSGIPAEAGVYVVYDAVYRPETGTVTLRRVLYIGESSDVSDRIENHDRRPVWLRRVGAGGTLCFAFAPIAMPERLRAEAALINHHKPPVNDEYANSFPFPDTAMELSGTTALIDTFLTVRATSAQRSW